MSRAAWRMWLDGMDRDARDELVAVIADEYLTGTEGDEEAATGEAVPFDLFDEEATTDG